MTNLKSKVGKALNEAGALYEKKNDEYGDTYHQHGNLMKALFPNGIEMKTEEDFNRMGIFNMMVSKMCRYAQNYEYGGHKDSLDDLTVYSQMLQELDDV